MNTNKYMMFWVIVGAAVSTIVIYLTFPKQEVKDLATRYKIITLTGTTFDMDVTVLITDDTAFATRYVQGHLDTAATSDDFDARGVTFPTKDGKSPIVWLPSDFTCPVVSHELLHATIDIMNWAGVPLASNTEETYAYELQYLTNEFNKQIKPTK